LAHSRIKRHLHFKASNDKPKGGSDVEKKVCNLKQARGIHIHGHHVRFALGRTTQGAILSMAQDMAVLGRA